MRAEPYRAVPAKLRLENRTRRLAILGVVRSRQGGGHVVSALDAEALLDRALLKAILRAKHPHQEAYYTR